MANLISVLAGRAPRVRSASRAAARAGRWRQAAEGYRSLLRLHAATARDRVQLAHCLKEADEAGEALLAYRAAANAFPLDVDAQRQLALYLRREGAEDEAQAVFARAHALDGKAEDVAAEVALSGDRSEEAQDRLYLTGILAGADHVGDDNRNPFARLQNAWRLAHARAVARKGDAKASVDAYRALLASEPDRPSPWVQFGHALRKMDQPREALAAYRRALVITPRDADIYLHVGHALGALDRVRSAEEAYLTSWRLRPWAPHAKAELDALGWRPEQLDTLWKRGHAPPVVAPGAPVACVPSVAGLFPEPDTMAENELTIFRLLAGSLAEGFGY